MTFSPKLVIFDCDGVLVDSEPISIAVLVEVLGEHGFVLPIERAYDKLLGRSVGAIASLMQADFGLELTAEFAGRIRARLYARLKAELRPIPHVAQAVGGLPCACCVASSSLPERLALSLGVTGLAELFGPHVYSSSMVARGKPAPDLFLYAAAQMGVAPEQCVVVEDSAAGVQAAQAAGMRVLGFLGGSHAEVAGLAGRMAQLSPSGIVKDMRDLGTTLASLT